MELDAFQGEVIRRAEERDIEVPRHEAVYAILRPWAVRNRQRNEPTSSSPADKGHVDSEAADLR